MEGPEEDEPAPAAWLIGFLPAAEDVVAGALPDAEDEETAADAATPPTCDVEDVDVDCDSMTVAAEEAPEVE